MSNATVSPENRATAALELDQYRTNLISLINTRIGDEYVFAHVDTTSPPIDENGDFTYDVDTFGDVREARISASELAEIGSSGSSAFAARAADADSSDVVQVLQDLITALNNNDVDSVSASVDTVQNAFDQVLSERSRSGLRIQRLKSAETKNAQKKVTYEQLRADLVDADVADAFSRLNLANTTMQSAVAVAARILGPSLLDSM